MKFKDMLNEADEDTPEETPESAVGDTEESDALTQAKNDLIASFTNPEETETPAEDSAVPTEDDKAADASVDNVLSDENKAKGKRSPNPLAAKPYSERVTTMLSLMKEFGYYDLDYQIQDGNKSVITVAGNVTDEHINDLKQFASEIKINTTVVSSKIDDNKFITTITINNKADLQSFRSLVSSDTDATAEETPEEAVPEEAPVEETPTEEEAVPEEAPTEETPAEEASTEETPVEETPPEA